MKYTKPDNLEILYEDTHILVCVKPHGTAVQSRQTGVPDMVSLLKNHIAQSNLANASGHIPGHTPGKNKPSKPSGISGKGEPYLAVIHRLDQPVKGILVFAKTPFAARELNRQLQNHGFGKYYRALVDGQPPCESDTLKDYMVKDARTNTSRICTPDTPGAKLARLHYTVIRDTAKTPTTLQDILHQKQNHQNHIEQSATLSKFSELDIQLDTGRHHQIRVQLAHMGCPIVGDTKYNPHCQDSHEWQEIELCAYKLDFQHPKTHKEMHFELPG